MTQSALDLPLHRHIDVDECLLPQRLSPSDLFSRMPERVEQVFFANLEGVPPRMEVADWLAEVTEFKVNPSLASHRQLLTDTWRQHVESARARESGGGVEFAPTSYFTAYVSGKSAIRIPPRAPPHHAANDAPPRLPVPFDVHKFLVPSGVDGVWRAPVTLTCADALDAADAPVVLHYPSAGFEHWRRKYRILGAFDDRWWGRVPCRIPAHLQSRDVLRASNGGGAVDETRARAFYRAVIMREGRGELKLLRAHGLLVRIDFVSDVVARVAARDAK